MNKLNTLKAGWILMAALLYLGCLLSTGCQQVSGTAPRAGMVVMGGAAGAAVGHAIDKDSPLAAGMGAVAGAGLAHLAMGRDPAAVQSGFDLGYVQGQSDAIKRQYFLRLTAEQQAPAWKTGGRVRTYMVPGPEVLPDGSVLAPHVLPLRVTE